MAKLTAKLSLSEILQDRIQTVAAPPLESYYDEDEISYPAVIKTGLIQWSTSDNQKFVPTSNTSAKLCPGVYEIKFSTSLGYYFQKLPVLDKGLIRFPNTTSDKIIDEIQKFWEREELFKEYKLNYQRGILLYGQPGGGKSCVIQLAVKDIIDRNGIVIKFTNPEAFNEGVRMFREIEPDTPLVVIMEDLDTTIQRYNESDVLNILDGVDQIQKVVYLATTNYPEVLGERIINRPSRFDKRFKIDYLDAESRLIYFKHIIGEERIASLNIDLDLWVKDTEEFSIAHLKELFTSVIILGNDYEEALETLKDMKEIKLDSGKDTTRKVGFWSNSF